MWFFLCAPSKIGISLELACEQLGSVILHPQGISLHILDGYGFLESVLSVTSWLNGAVLKTAGGALQSLSPCLRQIPQGHAQASARR